MATYPTELTSQLKANDSVVKYVPLEYGWVAITEERVLYNTRIYYTDTKSKQVETANLPITKISSIATKQIKVKACIGSKSVGVLAINVQGTVYNLMVGKNIGAAQSLIQEFNARSG
ncbi:MAG: hypothetical protein LBG62_03840 [Candidatus Methanoplasma sp.]|jgi:hypothetical protein|nr:hypothetical protein [Candidatus Methanoplasma sp.]